MPPDKNQNINLIPSDLERKRQVIKQVIARSPQEYTEAQNGTKKTKASFWSRLFAPKPKAKIEKSESIKIAAIKPTRLPTRFKAEKEPARASVLSAPKPDFLKVVATNAPVSVVPQPEPKKIEVAAAEIKKPAPTVVKNVEMTTASDGGKKSAPSGDDFGVNLLSGEYAKAFVEQNQKTFFAYAVAAAVALVVLVYLGLQLYQMQKTSQVESSQAANVELEGAINSFKDLDKEDKLLGRKVAVIKELLRAHISTRSFLEKLEGVTIPEVAFLALAASQEGGITVTARATSYTALARQLTVLQEDAPWIKEVSVAAASLVRSNQGAEEGVEFDMVMQVDPKTFQAATDK